MDKQEHLPQIDALRGIAAVMIAFIFHQYYLTGDFHDGPLRHLTGFRWFYRYGWTMVDLFFVISGFIMCHVYLGKGRKPPSARQFALARFARLYPLHLVTLVVTGAVLSLSVPAGYMYATPDSWHFLLNMLMLQQTSLADGMSFNAPSWSIAIEAYCYILFYLIIRFVPRWLPWVALGIIGAAVLIALPEGALSRHVGRGMCGFFVGVLIWRWGRQVPTFLLPVPAIAALWFLDDVTWMNKGSFLALTLYPTVALATLRSRGLDGPVFRWLGSRSYAIYLVNAPIYWLAAWLFYGGVEVPGEVAGRALVACLAAILVAAHFSYLLIEDPARRYLRKHFADRAEPYFAKGAVATPTGRVS